MTSDSWTAGEPPGRPRALARLVPAQRLAGFAAEHWSRQPLLTPAAELSGGFADVFGADAVDELTSRRGLRTPFLRIAKDGTVVAPSRFTGSGGMGAEVADQVVDDRVLALLGDGATLVLQGLHRTWPPVVTLAADLAAELGHPVQVNAYITPPQNRGFAAHYDTHDVFVVQIAGSKRWRIHRPVLADPLPEQPWEQRASEVSARAEEQPVIDAVLAPGDVLYLPRGYVHAASALGATSIHLTIGVHPVTRQNLVRHLVATTGTVDELRTSLPMGVDLSDPDVLAAELHETVAALHAYLDRARPADIARLLGAELARATRPEPVSPLAQLTAAETVTADTPVRLRTGLRYRVEIDADGVHLRLRDRVIALPAAAGSAVKTLLAGAPVTPRELPGLDPDEQLVVTRRLLREAVLLPA